VLAVVVVSALMAGGCAQIEKATMVASLVATDAKWLDLVEGNEDVEGILSFWTDDAVIYFANRPPVRGKEALREMVIAGRDDPNFSITWETEEVHIARSRDLAQTVAPYTITATLPSGEVMEQHGNAVISWRREGGEWKCFRDTTDARGVPCLWS
jgi:ketosteroid isomerase-like protein